MKATKVLILSAVLVLASCGGTSSSSSNITSEPSSESSSEPASQTSQVTGFTSDPVSSSEASSSPSEQSSEPTIHTFTFDDDPDLAAAFNATGRNKVKDLDIDTGDSSSLHVNVSFFFDDSYQDPETGEWIEQTAEANKDFGTASCFMEVKNIDQASNFWMEINVPDLQSVKMVFGVTMTDKDQCGYGLYFCNSDMGEVETDDPIEKDGDVAVGGDIVVEWTQKSEMTTDLLRINFYDSASFGTFYIRSLQLTWME